MRNIIDENRSVHLTYFLVCAVLIGIVVRIFPYFYNRSLWVDEANLASSICTREVVDLVSSPLDFGQSAPIGWLYIVKLITLVFGTSKAALRSWSLFSSLGVMILFYYLLKNKCSNNYVLLFIAFFSLNDKYIYFGNELKPYMSDCFFSLASLMVWQKYKERKLTLFIVVSIYSLVVWFSFPAVFFIASCMLVECLDIAIKYIKSKDFSDVIQRMAICSLVLISFVTYYIIWLSKTSTNAGAPEYWELLRFPLMPKTISDIKLIYIMGKQFIAYYPLWIGSLLVVAFVCYAIISIINKKEISLILWPCIGSVVILLVASSMGFYPIQDRLLQVYGIILLLFACCICDKIDKQLIKCSVVYKKVVIIRMLCWLGLFMALGFIAKDGIRYLFRNHNYLYGSEVSRHQEYLYDNLDENDLVYVQFEAYPSFLYENDYKISCFGLDNNMDKTFERDYTNTRLITCNSDFIRGHKLIHYYYEKPYSYDGYIDMELVKQDANYICNYKSAYIYSAHNISGIPELLDELGKRGKVTKVVDYYGTCLYHFVMNE